MAGPSKENGCLCSKSPKLRKNFLVSPIYLLFIDTGHSDPTSRLFHSKALSALQHQ